jgi:hypothetical protein
MNHPAPSLAGPIQSYTPIVQTVIDSDQVGAVTKNFFLESGGSGFRVFTADSSYNNIRRCKGKPVSKPRFSKDADKRSTYPHEVLQNIPPERCVRDTPR